MMHCYISLLNQYISALVKFSIIWRKVTFSTFLLLCENYTAFVSIQQFNMAQHKLMKHASWHKQCLPSLRVP